VYCNSYTKFQTPDTVGNCHFTIPSKQFHYDTASKLNLTIYSISESRKSFNFFTIRVFKKRQNYPCNRPWRPTGLWDVEAPTFSLDNRFTDGGKVVSLTCRPPFTPQEDSWYSFLLGVHPKAIVRLEGLHKLKKKIHLIGTRTRNLPACSTVSQPTTLPRTPRIMFTRLKINHTEVNLWFSSPLSSQQLKSKILIMCLQNYAYLWNIYTTKDAEVVTVENTKGRD
jgi:hypothetical protein